MTLFSKSTPDEMIVLILEHFPRDDYLERLYKLRIRHSEKLKTALALYNMEIHQMKANLDYHRLKTTVKRSIEEEARNGRRIKHAARIRGNNVVFSKDTENVGSGKPAGSVRKEAMAVSGMIHMSVPNLRHSPLLLQNIQRRKMGCGVSVISIGREPSLVALLFGHRHAVRNVK